MEKLIKKWENHVALLQSKLKRCTNYSPQKQLQLIAKIEQQLNDIDDLKQFFKGEKVKIMMNQEIVDLIKNLRAEEIKLNSICSSISAEEYVVRWGKINSMIKEIVDLAGGNKSLIHYLDALENAISNEEFKRGAEIVRQYEFTQRTCKLNRRPKDWSIIQNTSFKKCEGCGHYN